MASESVLVTGGAGFISSHLVDRLVAGGRDVRVLDGIEPQVHGDSKGYRSPGAEYFEGPVLDPDLLAAALEDVETVVHLAAQVGVGQSMYDMWIVEDAPAADDQTQRSTSELAERGLVL